MARIVFVHGIAQMGRDRPGLETEWSTALAAGLRAAGHDRMAQSLLAREDAVSVAMCCYAPEVPAGRQGSPGVSDPADTTGPADLDEEAAAVADEIAEEWLEHAVKSPVRREARAAQLALHQLRREPGESQGARDLAVRVVGGAARSAALTWCGIRIGQLGWASLREVVDYLTKQPVRDRARERCRELIGPDTRVVIGHSLGSVVAYEALRGTPHLVPTFVTLGSPLGLSAVRRRLEFSAGWPHTVRLWFNAADPADFVAARPNLAPYYPAPRGARLEQDLRVDNSFRPHRVGFTWRRRCAAGWSARRLLTHSHARRPRPDSSSELAERWQVGAH
jgi:hypothetical protein